MKMIVAFEAVIMKSEKKIRFFHFSLPVRRGSIRVLLWYRDKHNHWRNIAVNMLIISSSLVIFTAIAFSGSGYIMSVKTNVAADEGNSRNETWHWTNDDIGVAVQSWFWVRVELIAW